MKKRPIIEPFRIKVVEPIPRRVYTQSHIDYVAAVGAEIAEVRSKLPGMRILEEPRCLRHFTAAMAPLSPFPDFEVGG